MGSEMKGRKGGGWGEGEGRRRKRGREGGEWDLSDSEFLR